MGNVKVESVFLLRIYVASLGKHAVNMFWIV